MTTDVDRRGHFRALHQSDQPLVLPNPWDTGSARLLEHAGAQALATTSSGFAWTLGRADQQTTLDELVAHVRTMIDVIDVPLHVDSERCFADDVVGVADTVAQLADAGAAGCSIEDYDPATGAIDPFAISVERVAAAAEACRVAPGGMLLTARCEHHLYGVDDLDATIERLTAYRDAGAECVYAPGLTDPDDIGRVCDATGVAVNVLLMRRGPSVPELASLGVRRVSTGGALASVAYGSALAEFGHIRDEGLGDRSASRLTATDTAVFDRR